MLLIGLGHRARQGKNTAAVALMEHFPIGLDIRMVSFADALKEEVNRMARQCRSFHGLAELLREVYGAPDWVTAVFEGKQRAILQWWGTDYRRAKEPDYWVTRLFERLDTLKPDVAICTDVRFPNEADAFHRAGGLLIKVTRLGDPDIAVHEHPSEAALDGYTGWDFEIRAKDIPELKRQARDIYAEIERRHADILGSGFALRDCNRPREVIAGSGGPSSRGRRSAPVAVLGSRHGSQ